VISADQLAAERADFLRLLAERDAEIAELRGFLSAFTAAEKSLNAIDVGRRSEADRRDWILSEIARLPRGARILDAGAGEQPYRAPARAAGLDYVAQDFARYDGEGDGSALQTGKWDYAALEIISDITAIPEPDGSFDAVLCSCVLEHVPSPVEALREIARLLRPGGTLILTAPAVSFVHFAPFFYHAGFSRHFYEEKLPPLGLKIEDMRHNGSFFEIAGLMLRQLPAHAGRYAGVELSLQEQHSAYTVLQVLQRAQDNDKGSWELAATDIWLRVRKHG
jgi:SAM-dependent methyltransferase